MKFEILKDWMALLGLGGLAGTVLALIAKAVIERKTQDHEHRWQEDKELRGRAQDTDRATYNQPLTVLVREHLATFIRSGEWPTGEEDLRHLLVSLNQKGYEQFLDPTVERAWEALVGKSAELAARRLGHRIREWDVWEYNRLHTDWENACKRSFGPLPSTPAPAAPPAADPLDSASGGT